MSSKKKENCDGVPNELTPFAMLQTIRTMPRVFSLVWKAHPGLASVFCLSQLLQGLVPLAQVWSFKLLVDAMPAALHLYSKAAPANVTNLPSSITLALALIAISWFVTEIARPLEDYCREQLNDHLTRDISLLLMDKVNSAIDISILENPKIYDKLQRLQNDLNYKPIQMVHSCSQLGETLIALVGLCAILFSLSPWPVLLILLLCTPKLCLELKQANEMWSIVEGEVPEVRRMRYYTSVLTNNMDGKEVRLFGLGQYFRKSFLGVFDKFRKTRSRLRNSQLVGLICLSGLASFGTAVSCCWAVLQSVNGQISAGMMVMYLGAIGQIESKLGFCVFLFTVIYKHALYLNELFEFLEIPPNVQDPPPETAKRVPVPVLRGIEFRNVSFKYPGSASWVLKDVSFKIAPRETLAVVGENGAGKSTIVKLLTRLYDPCEGQILIDGIDLKEIKADEWRDQISVVFQDYCRFQLTVRENIGVGSLKNIENQSVIRSAAELGGAENFITRLEQGYETLLGKMFKPGSNGSNASNTSNDSSSPTNSSEQAKNVSGVELSGGEWQKIALARAFMRSHGLSDHLTDRDKILPIDRPQDHTNGDLSTDAQLLILDEPTASLDVQSEHDVYSKFHQLTKDKMALLITHRFSTVQMADRIIMLENGKIIEEGSHETLMLRASRYAYLYRLQADRYR